MCVIPLIACWPHAILLSVRHVFPYQQSLHPQCTIKNVGVAPDAQHSLINYREHGDALRQSNRILPRIRLQGSGNDYSRISIENRSKRQEPSFSGPHSPCGCTPHDTVLFFLFSSQVRGSGSTPLACKRFFIERIGSVLRRFLAVVVWQLSPLGRDVQCLYFLFPGQC